MIQATPDKTTTVLGKYVNDTDNIINDQIGVPKNTNFTEAKPGSFNLLNTPNEMYNKLGPIRFWNEINKPFLDAAIKRGDDIYLATKPTPSTLTGGFAKEYDYLITNGYKYDAATGKMVKGVKK